MKRAFIIHGYGATPEDHWFSWLAQQLQAAGVATVRSPADIGATLKQLMGA